MRRPRHLYALLPVLLCTGLVLGACSSGSSSSSSVSKSTTAATQTTTAGTEKEDKGSGGGSSVVPLNQPPTPASASTPAPAATPSQAAAAPAPDGYQSVSTRLSKISFAVPSNWVVFTKLDTEENQQLAEILGITSGEVAASTLFTDLMTLSPYRDNLGVLEGVECVSLALTFSEDQMQTRIQEFATDNGHTLAYSTTTESANGTIYYGVTYASDTNLHVGAAFLPTADKRYVFTKVYASSTGRVEELLGVVASTLR